MSEGFNNPIIGGGGALVYPSIHSPKYAHNVAGWSINKDGSAEFNNVTIRNGQVISGVSLYYNGAPAAGNLIASIAASGGTDSFGNAYLSSFATYDPPNGLALQHQGGVINFYSGPTSGAGPWTGIGSISTGNFWQTFGGRAIVLSPAAGVTAEVAGGQQFLIGTGAPATSDMLEVQGTVHASGIITPGAGTNCSGSAPQLAPGLVVGTPSQLSDTTRDYMVYLTVGTAGTGVQVKIGPNNPPVRNVYGSATPTAGQQIVFRLPAGFWAEVTGTGTTLAAQNAIGC